MQTEVTSFANNSLPTLLDVTVAYVCTPCWMLLRVVGSCFTEFEFGQTFKPSTPDITFVPWSPKRSATMLDPFAKLFQHCWRYARASCIASKVLWAMILTMHCRSQHFWDLLRPFADHCQHGPNNSQHCCQAKAVKLQKWDKVWQPINTSPIFEGFYWVTETLIQLYRHLY